MKYMNDLWRKNNGMWEVGAKKIPYVIQNINAFIESYHSNLKSIQDSLRNYFVGRRIDWLIYHLVGDIITHYSYGVQCKSYRFVLKICIVSLAKFCAHVIFDTNIFICWGGGCCLQWIGNNRPKMLLVKNMVTKTTVVCPLRFF